MAKISKEIRPSRENLRSDDREPFMIQFDATRDIKGTFYSQNDFRNHYQELKRKIEQTLRTKLRDNSNSFNSCF